MTLTSDSLSALDDFDRERFVIKTDRQAEWALRKLIRAQAEIDRQTKSCEDQKQHLNMILEQNLRGRRSDVEFFTRLLAEYHQAKREQGAPKTYPLTYGQLVATKTRKKVEVSDVDALRDYAEGFDRLDLIRIKVEPDKKALLAAVEAGEEVPGVEVSGGDSESFSVRLERIEVPEFDPMPDEEAE